MSQEDLEVKDTDIKNEENMSWEEYITELNKYAKSLRYQDAYAMRDDLLNKTASVFYNNLNKEKINELGGEEKAMFSIKSVLKKLTVDNLNTALIDLLKNTYNIEVTISHEFLWDKYEYLFFKFNNINIKAIINISTNGE